jgi:signal transduction histidine kinase
MRLGEFIEQHGREILLAWEKDARQQAPHAAGLDRPALMDRVPQLLTEFAHVMAAGGERPSVERVTVAHADEHASERIEHGFQVGFAQVAQAAFQEESLDSFLDRVLHVFKRYAPSVDSAAILLRDDDRVRVRAAVGLEEEARPRVSLQLGEGFAGTIAATGKPLFLHDAWSGPLVRSQNEYTGTTFEEMKGWGWEKLSAISMSATTIPKSPDLPPALGRPAGRILKNVERMSRMVSDLLDFTRGRPGGGIPIEPQRIDLRDVVSRVRDEREEAHPESQILVETHGDTDGTWDAERLAQALINLASNAIQHGERDRPVRIAVDGSTEGLGLGLFIACEIVWSHGGVIRVESSAAEGTTFRVTLPRTGRSLGRRGCA